MKDFVSQQASTASYLTSGATVYMGLTINEWGVLVGITLGILTFVVNFWFKWDARKGGK
jgi:hypothetical protein